VRAAAGALRALHAAPERRRAMGAAASAEMEVRRRAFLSGEAFDRLEPILPPRGNGPDTFRRALLRTRAWLYWRALRNAPRAVARRLGLVAS
jgi:hypothetical protein